MDSTALDPVSVQHSLTRLTALLVSTRNAGGYWEGELSSSALSTATAIFAIDLYERQAGPETRLHEVVERGVDWLAKTQNSDGGWGDTILSFSNISTTALCWAALSNQGPRVAASLRRAEEWLTRAAGSLAPADLAHAIKERYGKDHTFSVPILTMCALAGRLGEGRDGWMHVPQLPFELAACPYRWFQWLRLPVVSYALPALIAIGQVRHACRPSWNPFTRALRYITRGRTLRLLSQIQPAGGGFLEATPLTSFVVMSLLGAGLLQHIVVGHGIDFLSRSARPDGSWPIDTNLATWLTTLSVNALAEQADLKSVLNELERNRIHQWLITQQFQGEHPFTHAAPGAWAWTDLPGGVPDADDTAGALLALWNLGDRSVQTLGAVRAGIAWLLDLQNRDGGVPTFCRGWTNLPFDRSGCDLTAHALAAWSAWRDHLDADLAARIDRAVDVALRFLYRRQHSNGSWVPLWFGNQHSPDEENPTYGTAKVLAALCVLHSKLEENDREMCRRAALWLIKTQQADGGWGGGASAVVSIEETALALLALTTWAEIQGTTAAPQADQAIFRGTRWLVSHAGDESCAPAPIGFYFARLWYFERQYPIIYACAALGHIARSNRGTGFEFAKHAGAQP